MNAHVQWLLATGRFASDPATLLSGLANRLCDDGLDLIRMNLQPRTLHPEISIMLYIWRPSEGHSELNPTAKVVETTLSQHEFGTVQEIGLGHESTNSEAFRASPFNAIKQGTPRVRARITPDATTFEFPILRDLAAAGATDYVAWPLRLGDGSISYFSLTTRKPGGLSDTELESLESLLDPLAMCIEIQLRRHVAQSLLRTYLGTSAGDAVLAGQVRRGDVQRVEAAIWFSDLRGFTEASSTIDPSELVAWLNEYFSAMALPLAQHQGEILKFIGDAILAIFPVSPERSRAAACADALQAATAGNAELQALNERRATRGLPELKHGIGLHVGEVMYGNIGADRRLDFTVIGQAVNLASRIESLCSKLGRNTLASADLAALAGGSLSPVGTFELKGLPGSHVVYGL